MPEQPKPSAGVVAAAQTIFPWLSDHYQAELQRTGSYGNGESRLAEILEAEIGVAELLEAAKLAYVKLADVSFQWLGRSGPEGQSLLCKLRDAIAKAQGQKEEEVQSWAVQQSISKAERGM